MIPPRRTVAAFDLDGTLTRRDTLLPFLRRVRGRARTCRALLVHSPLICGAQLFERHRDGAKAAVLADLLQGQETKAVAGAAAIFAEDVVDRRLRPGALDQIRAHRRAGHQLVLVSASPALYVEPIGRLLGFDAVLATRLEADPDGRLTGRIEGLNCRGAEKVARFREWAGERSMLVYAYGDSAGDRELLAVADTAFSLRRRGWPARRRPVWSGSDVVVDDPGVGVDR